MNNKFWKMCENCIKRNLKKENKSFSNLIEAFGNPKFDYIIEIRFSYNENKIGKAILKNQYCGMRKPELDFITYEE